MSNLFDEKCNCGKPVRYTHNIDGEFVGSCNKYQVCPTYEELESKLSSLQEKYLQLLNAAATVVIFKEGTEQYIEADYIIYKHRYGDKL